MAKTGIGITKESRIPANMREVEKVKLLGFEIINNRHNRYITIDIEKRIREVYIKGDNEAAYAAYRAITGTSIQESWRVVKPWIKKWEGRE